MKLYMHHGRVDPEGQAQRLEADGEPIDVDDWGFDGPSLDGCVGFHVTYGEFGVYFESEGTYLVAKATTGWDDGNGEWSLFTRTSDNDDLLKIWDEQYQRFHYFGDWGLK